LIDCGEGTQMHLLRNHIKISRLRHVLISHLHGDHYFGLIGLISTLHLFGRRYPLNIYAPAPLKSIIEAQLEASETALNFELFFHPLGLNDIRIIIDEKKYIVEAFPMKHRITCHGFRISEKPKPIRINKELLPEDISIADIGTLLKGESVLHPSGEVKYDAAYHTLPPKKSYSYAYCSDTIYDPGLVPYLRKADVLYHEATFAEDMAPRATETFHSTASQAADIAKKAEVSRLYLGHYSTRYKDPTPLLHEAKQVFDQTFLSEEGNTIILEP
jgi:ribonuclease Z